jgi:transposase
MIPIAIPARIYLSTKPVDFRKGVDGLCGVVTDYLGHNPLDGSLFVFYNRGRNKLKMLLWASDGFWLLYRQLEQGTFEFPKAEEHAVSYTLSHEQLLCILSGIVLRSVRYRKRYKITG